MFDSVAFAHLSIRKGRDSLENVIASRIQLQQLIAAGGPPGMIAQAVESLSLEAANVRVSRRSWTRMQAGLRNFFPAQGYHSHFIDMADAFINTLPHPAVRDDAWLYGLLPQQWLTALVQFSQTTQQQHFQLPQAALLDGDFDIARANFVIDSINRCGQLKNDAITAASAALAAPGNVYLMQAAEDAKRLLYFHADEALRVATSTPQFEQIRDMLTQAYQPLEQINM